MGVVLEGCAFSCLIGYPSHISTPHRGCWCATCYRSVFQKQILFGFPGSPKVRSPYLAAKTLCRLSCYDAAASNTTLIAAHRIENDSAQLSTKLLFINVAVWLHRKSESPKLVCAKSGGTVYGLVRCRRIRQLHYRSTPHRGWCCATFCQITL